MSDPTPAQRPAPYIRRATAADSPALSHICLVTADAGSSAEALHTAGELPGLLYAEPYAHLPTGFGFVLVDPAQPAFAGVVGYALGTWDTRQLERDLDAAWFPPHRERYPLAAGAADATDAVPPHLHGLTLEDRKFVRLIHAPPAAPDVAVAFSPAHMHIDITAAYQRQGWGKKLIGELVRFLRDEKGLEGLWLGLDPRNSNAKKFYSRLGFKGMPEAPGAVMSLDFADWKD